MKTQGIMQQSTKHPMPLACLATRELSINQPDISSAEFFFYRNSTEASVRQNYKIVKRAIDIFIALTGMIVFAPVIIFCSLLIKIISMDGPAIYCQRRIGKNANIFTMFKLRTMRTDAEKHTGPIWSAGTHDPRLIPIVGAFLRRTHLDELPQLVNVLSGDMSIVGPRPERPEIAVKLAGQVPEYTKRLQVRPGITGLAQIRHSYDVTLRDVKKKVKLDLLYIRNMCLWNETSILLRTIVVVVRGKVIT